MDPEAQPGPNGLVGMVHLVSLQVSTCILYEVKSYKQDYDV